MMRANECLVENHVHPHPLVEVDDWFPACLAMAIVEQQQMGVEAGIGALPETPMEAISMGLRAGLVLAYYFPVIADRVAYIALGKARIGVVEGGEVLAAEGALDTDRQLNRCANAQLIERAAELVGMLQEEAARKCRVCGCSNAAACAGGCEWVEPDLCSSCQPVAGGRAN